MDRTMTNGKGFTLVEVMIVTAIVGIILSIGIFSFTRIRLNESINDDMHGIFAFLQRTRLTAFTTKNTIAITSGTTNGRTILTATPNGPNNAAAAVGSISLENPVLLPAALTINSRGLFTQQGRICTATEDNTAPFPCVVITAARLRLGGRE